MAKYTWTEVRNFIENLEKNNSDGLPKELKSPVDIVIVDCETRAVQCVSVWIALINIARIKRLVERENKEWKEFGREAVVVPHDSVNLGDILLGEVIKL